MAPKNHRPCVCQRLFAPPAPEGVHPKVAAAHSELGACRSSVPTLPSARPGRPKSSVPRRPPRLVRPEGGHAEASAGSAPVPPSITAGGTRHVMSSSESLGLHWALPVPLAPSARYPRGGGRAAGSLHRPLITPERVTALRWRPLRPKADWPRSWLDTQPRRLSAVARPEAGDRSPAVVVRGAPAVARRAASHGVDDSFRV